MKLAAVILTYNEEPHLARCLTHIKSLTSDIIVVDSYSTDKTIEIALAHGAVVIQNEFITQSQQFNWALTQLKLNPYNDWVLRIDADEILTNLLAREIKLNLYNVSPQINGFYCNRHINFQGKTIRHGGIFPLRVLRLFRFGWGQCENRLMDEHIKVVGFTAHLNNSLIDDNLNSLTWWTEKHNKYASREAVDMLNLEYGFMPRDTVACLKGGGQTGFKRWLKEHIYARLPSGFRAFAYFFYRYVVRFGFLDGHAGSTFHFLQGFWYRYLVDAKVSEVKRYMRANDAHVVVAIERVLGIKV